MNSADLIKIGFKRLSHWTVNNAHVYNIGRGRELSVGDVGTPNEVVAIVGRPRTQGDISLADVVILHNYDYDGYMTVERLRRLLDWFSRQREEAK